MTQGSVSEWEEAVRYVEEIENGGAVQHAWTVKIRNRRHQDGYSELYARLMEDRNRKKVAREVKLHKFVDAYEKGNITDRSLYAQLIGGIANRELSQRFASIHAERLKQAQESLAERTRRMIELKDEGRTTAEIAKMFGLDPATVAYHLKRHSSKD